MNTPTKSTSIAPLIFALAASLLLLLVIPLKAESTRSDKAPNSNQSLYPGMNWRDLCEEAAPPGVSRERAELMFKQALELARKEDKGHATPNYSCAQASVWMAWALSFEGDLCTMVPLVNLAYNAFAIALVISITICVVLASKRSPLTVLTLKEFVSELPTGLAVFAFFAWAFVVTEPWGSGTTFELQHLKPYETAEALIFLVGGLGMFAVWCLIWLFASFKFGRLLSRFADPRYVTAATYVLLLLGLANGTYRGQIGELQLRCYPKLHQTYEEERRLLEIALLALPPIDSANRKQMEVSDQLREDYFWANCRLAEMAHQENIANCYRSDAERLYLRYR